MAPAIEFDGSGGAAAFYDGIQGAEGAPSVYPNDTDTDTVVVDNYIPPTISKLGAALDSDSLSDRALGALGSAVGYLLSGPQACTPHQDPTQQQKVEPGEKLQSNPLAYALYQTLTEQGVPSSIFDKGYRAINYGGIHCPNDPKALSCLKGEGDGEYLPQEILERVLNDRDIFQRCQATIEKELGSPLPLPLRELVIDKFFDETTKRKIRHAITELNEILKKQGIQEDSAEYKRKLNRGLSYFMSFPSAVVLDRWIRKHSFDFNDRTKELSAIGLGSFRSFLRDNGGISDLSLGCDPCLTEGEKVHQPTMIRFAVLSMAGLKPKFRAAYYHIGGQLKYQFVLRINLKKEGDETHFLFVPNLLNSDPHRYYPLSRRQYLGEYYRDIASFHLNEKAFDQAHDVINLALQIDEENSQHHIQKALILKGQNKLEEALKSCDRALAIDPKDSLAKNIRGLLLHAQGNLAQAEADYQKSIQLSRDFRDPYTNLVELYMEQGRLSEALEMASQYYPKFFTQQAWDAMGDFFYAGAKKRWSAEANKRIAETFKTEMGMELHRFQRDLIIAYSQWNGDYPKSSSDYRKGSLKTCKKRLSTNTNTELSPSTQRLVNEMIQLMPESMKADPELSQQLKIWQEKLQ